MQKNKDKQSLLFFSQARLLCFVTKELPSNDVLYAHYTAHYNYDHNLTSRIITVTSGCMKLKRKFAL